VVWWAPHQNKRTGAALPDQETRSWTFPPYVETGIEGTLRFPSVSVTDAAVVVSWASDTYFGASGSWFEPPPITIPLASLPKNLSISNAPVTSRCRTGTMGGTC